MAPWTLAPSLVQLRNELNARWPNRDKSSDGAIGDAAHAATPSDHNPNAQGVVCAYDIDTDLDGTDDSNDLEMEALVEWLRLHPQPTLKYLIFRANDPRFGIFRAYDKPGIPAFTWSTYTKDPHISHPHISVGQGPDGQSKPGTYEDTTPWLVGFQWPTNDDPPPPPPTEDDMTPCFVEHPTRGPLVYVIGDDKAAWEYADGKAPRRLDGSFTSGLAARLLPDGGLALYGRGDEGALWRLLVTSDGVPAGLAPMGGHIFPP